MGTDEATLIGLMNDKYIPVLFCVNKKQYKLLSKGIKNLDELKKAE